MPNPRFEPLTIQTQWRLCHLGLDLTHLQMWAFGYLEKHGQTFLVHFGTENAVEKAEELLWQEYGQIRIQ